MKPGRKILLIGGVLLGAQLLICGFWAQTNPRPQLQLPAGISLQAALDHGAHHEPKGWYTNHFVRFSFAQQLSGSMIRFRFQNLLGHCSMPVPNPPGAVDMRSNLADCSTLTGETYLLARELFPDNYSDDWPGIDFNLSYKYGGSNRVRTAREWVALNETGIVENGVVALRKKNPLPTTIGEPLMEPYQTNVCAVIRDARGVVKIVPLSCLRAYSEAGLIRLPDERSGLHF